MSRATFVALGLAVLLLADGLATLPDHVVRAAKGETTGQQSSVADVVVCAPGFDDVETKPGMSLHGVARVPKGAIAVGYARRSLPGHNGVRVPATLINRGKGWTRLPTASAGDEDGLMAVASRGGGQPWAVGFTTIKGEVKPLAMRWNGKRWVTDRPRVGAPVAVLTDVDIVKGGSPFAVGYRMTAGGKRKPLVLRKDGPRWRSIPMRSSDRESVTLAGVGSDGRNGTWVVGHGGADSAVKPLIYLRDKGRWTSVRVPAIKGEAALADVVAAGPRDSWAVGYHRRGDKAHPLVLRWNGTRWKRAEAPSFDSNEALLSAVSVDPAGGIWVVGAAWDDERKEFEAVAAWWDGRAWNETVGRTGGNELNDVVGSLRENGWAVGRSNGAGRVARVCLPPQSGVFGSSEAPASQGSTGTGGADEADELAPGSTAFDDDPEALDADDLETFETQGEAADERSANLRRKGKKAGKATGKIGTLPPATTDKRIVARDVARPAGIYEDTGTYGAVVEDFDGDG
ncbi:MAG: hypothetical protein PVG27_11845, partial [Chloroflexota bacterium]